jgi:hypothetical protein
MVIPALKYRLSLHIAVYIIIAEARPGDGLLILADGYPEQTTPFDAALLERAADKHLRVFIEYPTGGDI